MACDGAFSVPQDYFDFWCFECSGSEEENTVRRFLTMAAADIHAHLAAVGACDCTLAAWATEFLKKLNVIEAAVVHNCPCGRTNLKPEERQMWLEWLDRQYELIRTQKIDVCAGATGAEYPVVGWASQSLTEQTAATIIANDIRRSGS